MRQIQNLPSTVVKLHNNLNTNRLHELRLFTIIAYF